MVGALVAMEKYYPVAEAGSRLLLGVEDVASGDTSALAGIFGDAVSQEQIAMFVAMVRNGTIALPDSPK
jgi:hypothetical protein